MTLASMTLHLVELPRRRTHRWAKLQGNIGKYVLLQLRDQDGFEGWGEATALGSWGGDHGRHYGETYETVSYVLSRLIGPAVLDGVPRGRHETLDLADSVVRGHPYAKTAFECAYLDLCAKRAGLPVHELIGGARRATVPLAHSLGLMEQQAAIEEAQQVVAEGVRTLKVKVGEDSDRDVAMVEALYSAVGDRADIAVDANQGWGTAVAAERTLRRLTEVPLRYVEQPVEGLAQLAALAPRVPFPLMADESMWTANDMAELARTGVIGCASIYTSKGGGLTGAREADAVAGAFGISTNVNGSGETGVGNLANLHLAAAMVSLGEGCVLPVSAPAGSSPTSVAGRMYTDDVLVTGMGYRDGELVVPDGPGWGIDVDPDKLQRFRVEMLEVKAG